MGKSEKRVCLTDLQKLIDMHQGTLEMESKTKEEADDGSREFVKPGEF